MPVLCPCVRKAGAMWEGFAPKDCRAHGLEVRGRTSMATWTGSAAAMAG